MCGRFVQSMTVEQLAELYGISGPLPNAPPRYNIAPTQSALVVRFNPETGKRQLDPLMFGLVPVWAKDKTRAASLINARGETLAEKPSFRDAYAKRRCLIPVDAFYEWKPDGKAKQPYAIRRADGGNFAIAGLWERWRDPASKEITRSFAIVTTNANAKLSSLHERMPVILDPADWTLWLGEAPGDPSPLIQPHASESLIAYRVSPAVSKVANDDASLLLELKAGA